MDSVCHYIGAYRGHFWIVRLVLTRNVRFFPLSGVKGDRATVVVTKSEICVNSLRLQQELIKIKSTK